LREAGRAGNEAKYTAFKLGCDAGDVAACNSLGEWWALMRQDYNKAAELYTHACVQARHPQSCLNLGLLLATGRGGVAPSLPQAARVFGISCEEGNADGCSEASRLLLQEALVAQRSNTSGASVATPDTIAASSGSAVTGGRSSAGVATTAAPSVASPQALLAERYLSLGCESGTSVANAKCCGLLGTLYLSQTFGVRAARPPTVPELLQRACEGEHGSSCMRLAALYRHGAPALDVARDTSKAAAYERQGLLWSGLSPAQADKVMAGHGRGPGRTVAGAHTHT
jgi:TPR repeat protein